MKVRFNFIFGFYFIFIGTSLYSQSPDSSSRFGITAMTDLSYTGINTSLSGSFSFKKIKFTAGIKKNINKSYIPSTSPFGIIGNLAFIPEHTHKRISGFFNIDYRVTFLKPYCPAGNCSVNYNYIHEYSLGYGFQFMVSRRLTIINNINVGRYSEHFYSEFQDKRIVFKGYNTLIAVGLNYGFY